MSHLAPVIVFCYARPDHLRRTVESLRANAEAAQTEVWFFCDAAKRAEHEPQVREVREFVAAVDGFGVVHRVWRERNFGLAASIIDGVTRVLAERGRAIVVEDDLLLSPHFLRYMNDGLDTYADDESVASIHGYNYPTGCTLPDTFFIRGADCWGWATWSRAWRHFEPDGSRLLARLRERGLERTFDFDGSHAYTAMLQAQIEGRNDSWAVRWYASCFLDGMLTLYPGRSLVENIGNDGSGTHAAATGQYSQVPAAAPVPVQRTALAESLTARRAFVEYFHRTGRTSLVSRAGRSISRLLTGRA